MAYSTEADIRTLLKDPTEDQVSVKAITLFQRQADSIIDSRLACSYSIPVVLDGTSTTPDQIKTIAEQITIYLLSGMSWFAVAQAISMDEAKKRYDQAIEWLEAVAERSQGIPGVTPSTVIESDTEDYPTIFNLDDENNWELSADQEDAIADTREG